MGTSTEPGNLRPTSARARIIWTRGLLERRTSNTQRPTRSPSLHRKYTKDSEIEPEVRVPRRAIRSLELVERAEDGVLVSCFNPPAFIRGLKTKISYQ